MTFTQKISLAYKEFARKREDRKLVREMERAMPGMMAEMERIIDNMSAADLSIGGAMTDAKKYYDPRALDQLQSPVVVTAGTPFDPRDCTVLQNPMTVTRQPIRVRSGA
ncbi:MAG: hypothetical protein ACAH80_17770 [Alphaproteobacteria bacterium]